MRPAHQLGENVSKKFIMCKGLPGCGKSTWATEKVLAAAPGQAVRVNQDLLRIMLHADRFSGRKTESLVAASKQLLIREFMAKGVPLIISDDTNFAPSCEKDFRDLCEAWSYEFEVKDFTDVPVETCIERDLKRASSVGEKVIRKMWRKYLESPHNRVPAPPRVEGAPSAIVVDIDGTVALMNGRSPYDPTRYHTDLQNEAVVELVQQMWTMGEHIVFCSGRDDTYRDSTTAWIEEHLELAPRTEEEEPDWPVRLFMRPADDKRNDAIIKRELYEANIKGKYNVRFVLDDRDRVVEMWRSEGLTCLQVAPGDF